MREIKFRAWIPEQKRMTEPVDLLMIKTWSFPLSWAVVMQFTGLKDKNGKEIYEGDIFQDEEDGSCDFVEWSDFHCGWTTSHWFGSIEFAKEAKSMEIYWQYLRKPRFINCPIK